MKFSSFFKDQLTIILLACILVQPALSVANVLSPNHLIVPTAGSITGGTKTLLLEEKRLSPALQSPKKADFTHVAAYWLEHYAHPSINKNSHDGFVAHQQTLLLSVLLGNTPASTAPPKKHLNLLQELQFLNIPGKKSVFSSIDTTITQTGKFSLFSLLSTENTNWHVLTQRQNFLKYLIKTPHLKEALEWHLGQINLHEKNALQAICRAEAMSAERELLKMNLRANGAVGWLACGLWSLYEKYIYKVDSLNTFSKFCTSVGMVISIPLLVISSATCFAGTFGAFGATEIVAPVLLLYGIGFAGSAFFMHKNIDVRARALRASFDIAKSTALSIKNAYAMHAILHQNHETRGLYPAIPVCASPAWKELYRKAMSKTFAEEKEFSFLFSNHGRAENLIMLCKDTQDELSQLLRFYGELDAYTALAEVYTTHQTTTNDVGEKITYCFANMVENQQTAQLHAKNFWHPIIPIDRVRASSLELGGPEKLARNMVITGPNAGGKSVNLKALFVNLILAQTCGLACAENFIFTPFEKLIGKFRGVDDIASDKSKFMLEAIEMTALLKEMMSLKPHEHAFVETDELFTGTEIGPAISLSLELCAQVARLKNVMYILATHYKQLCELPNITGGVFTNYKVEVFKSPTSHKLTYPYRLQPGIGNTNVAFDIFLEQLDKQGVDDPVLKEIITKAQERQEAVESSL